MMPNLACNTTCKAASCTIRRCPTHTGTAVYLRGQQGYFPLGASYASDSGDPWLRLLFAPTFRWFDRIVSRLTVIQHGHIHVYVLYVAATLLVLLVWASL